ncbi:MAG: hypothetical protein KDA48_04755 [Amphiplicatus sp.]|nr:hypothetical protein [Amphiplicatus sp.]
MDIKKALFEAAEKGVRDYANMSKSEDLIVPENWLQSQIAQYLHQTLGLSVVLEAPTSKYHWGSQELQCPFGRHEVGRTGRADLLAFDHSTSQWSVIEVKASQSTWPSFSYDAVRVRELVEKCAFSSGWVIYASCLMDEKKLKSEQDTFRKQIDAAKFGGLIWFSDPYSPLCTKSADRKWQIAAYCYSHEDAGG